MEHGRDSSTVLIGLARDYGLTISSAESLTGGLAAAMLVSVPGASYAFSEGFVTYALSAKERTLGVERKLLMEEGAISARTAEAMARGAALRAGTDIALSATGNAGPDASEGKPVGLCYTGVFIRGSCASKRHVFEGTRDEIRQKAAQAAVDECLAALKEYLRGQGGL